MSVQTPFANLEKFYQSPLGLWVSRTLAEKILSYWSPQKEQTFLGVGYPTPYMRHFQEKPGRWSVFMAGTQVGVWKKMGHMKAFPEGLCPFSDNQFDRLFLVHSIEFLEEPVKFFREMWRILKPEGEMILVIPHPYSFWSHHKETPWTDTYPYSLYQVLTFLEKTCFQLLQKEKALFAPPFQSSLRLLLSPFFEKAGNLGLWPFSGVWIIRVQKQVYSPIPQGKKSQPPLILVERGG